MVDEIPFRLGCDLNPCPRHLGPSTLEAASQSCSNQSLKATEQCPISEAKQATNYRDKNKQNTLLLPTEANFAIPLDSPIKCTKPVSSFLRIHQGKCKTIYHKLFCFESNHLITVENKPLLLYKYCQRKNRHSVLWR